MCTKLFAQMYALHILPNLFHRYRIFSHRLLIARTYAREQKSGDIWKKHFGNCKENGFSFSKEKMNCEGKVTATEN